MHYYSFFVRIRYMLMVGICVSELLHAQSIASDQTTSFTRSPFQARQRTRTGLVMAPKKSVPFKQMDEEELKLLQKKAVDEHNYTLAIKCLERRIHLAASSPERLPELLFDLADIQLEFGKFSQVIETTNDFKKRFPGHPLIEETYYQSCVASFLNILSSERDQTNTHEAVRLAHQYLLHTAPFEKYRSEVQAFKEHATQVLVNHEKKIIEFHTKRKNFTAARKRIDYIEQKLLADLPELHSQVLALKDNIATYQNHQLKISAARHRDRKKTVIV